MLLIIPGHLCDRAFTANQKPKVTPAIGPFMVISLSAGSTTGFGVRLLPDAKGVMIYLHGGGACYDAQS